MAPYIFTERNDIHIIDLQKSVGKVDETQKTVFDIANEGQADSFRWYKEARLRGRC